MSFENAAALCESLNLTDSNCLKECIYYNDVGLYEGFIQSDITFNSSEIINTTLLSSTLTWYALSATPYEWYAVGNPTMCLYSSGTYCYTPIIQKLDRAVMMHGCCIPGQCKDNDAIKVLQSNKYCFQTYLEQYNALNLSKLEFKMDLICDQKDRQWDASSIIMLMLVCILCLFIPLIATLIHHFHSKSDDKSIIKKFSSIFSVQSNIKDLIKQRKNNLFGFCDGIRAVTAYWVLVYHTPEHTSYACSDMMARRPGHGTVVIPSMFVNNNGENIPLISDNPEWNSYDHQSFWFNMTSINLSSMTTFLWLAGFFGIGSVIRVIHKWKAFRHSAKCSHFYQVILLYVRRYLRIMPIALFVMFMYMYLYDQIPSGYQVHTRDAAKQCCQNEFISIMFMFKNLKKFFGLYEPICTRQCLSHYWYVFLDFDLFLYLPIVALIWVDIGYIYGFASAALPIVIGWILRVYFGFYYDYILVPYGLGLELQNDIPYRQGFSDLYIAPWIRMGEYYYGVVLMLILIYVKEKKIIDMNKFVLSYNVYISLHSIVAVLMLSAIIVPYMDIDDYPDDRFSRTNITLYYIFIPQLWSIALCIFTFALRFRPRKHKSLVNIILSNRIMSILGKLSFLVYILHKIVIFWFVDNRPVPYYYDQMNYLFLIFGISIVTTAISFILWITVENPVSKLVTQIYKQLDKKFNINTVGNVDSEKLIDYEMHNYQNESGYGSVANGNK
eukprot:394232_1